MKHIHRVSTRGSATIKRELAALGVYSSDEGLVTFETDEDDPSWPALREWIASSKAFDLVYTTFTSEEILAATWLELQSEWHHGYPQPEDGGYREATYDLRQWCKRCGVGKMQRAPFQMSGEPIWGKRNVLQLNWVFDELFVKPEIWASVFEPAGVGCRPVLSVDGRTLESVVQLEIIEEVPVDSLAHPFERCAGCGRVKYLPVARGPFPAPTETPRGNLVRSSQYFGSGASAAKGVLVSRELASAIRSGAVQGAYLRPSDR